MTAVRRWSAAVVAAGHAALLLALATLLAPPPPGAGSTRPPLWVRLLADGTPPPAAPPPPVAPPTPRAAVPVAAALPLPRVDGVAPEPGPAATPADDVQAARPAADAVTAPPASPPPAPARVAEAPAPRREPPGHAGCTRAPHPPLLRERGIEGRVQLRVHVGADGRARQVQLLQSSGWRLFDEAALAQARGCRFRPAREDDTPVDGWVEFPVRFTLEG